MENESCGECKFGFDFENYDSGVSGECRRFPPAPVDIGVSQFSIVKSNDWCGEFAAIVAGTGKP